MAPGGHASSVGHILSETNGPHSSTASNLDLTILGLVNADLLTLLNSPLEDVAQVGEVGPGEFGDVH